MIDLHTHSSASDGSFSPQELVITACDLGLSALALTDHDTVQGIDEAMTAASKTQLRFIPGVEISAQSTSGNLHIVGLSVDPKNRALMDTLSFLVERRNHRNARIAAKLQSLGYDIELRDVEAIAKGGVIGRPHFAMALMQKGHVQSIQSAFRKLLIAGRPAWFPKYRLKRDEAIEVIQKAGGIPVLAHPLQTKKRGKDLDALVKDLTSAGLGGIEAYCSGYSQFDEHALIRLAKKFNLIVSGGSDFHGSIKPGIQLGTGTGHLHVPDHLLSPIHELTSKKN